jgi:hypothetical protein
MLVSSWVSSDLGRRGFMSRVDVTVRNLMVNFGWKAKAVEGRGGSFRPCEECALYEKCKAGEVENKDVSWPMACWVPEGVLAVWEEEAV